MTVPIQQARRHDPGMRTLLLLMVASTFALAAEPLRVTWQQVPSVCADRKSLIRLTSGTRVEGRLMAVSPTSFEFEVQRTSNAREVAKGIQTLDRAALAELRVRDKRIAGRVLGSIAGLILSHPIACAVVSVTADIVALPVFITVVTGGHMLGRIADLRSQVVIIEPGGTAGEEE